jgi:hypothetical protein
MDTNPAVNDSGFDAALRALEDLESSVALTREEIAPAPAAAPAPTDTDLAASRMISFAEDVQAEAIVEVTAEDVDAALASLLPIADPVPAPAPAAAPAPAPAPAAAPAPAPVAVAPIPVAAPAPAPISPAAAASAGESESDPTPAKAPVDKAARWTKVAIGLGLCSSLISAVGLIVAERSIMSAKLVVADARERQEQLKAANSLIHDLEIVRAKQIELLRAQQAQLASNPVTSEELRVRMENLQRALVERDPMSNVLNTIREGQSANNERIQQLGLKLEHLQRAIGE